MRNRGWKIPILVSTLLSTTSVFAIEQILHTYEDVRGAGMGGVFLTTGLYEQNFFGNPARATANPKFRVTLLDPTIEVDPSAVGTTLNIIGGQDPITAAANSSGTDNHSRLQTTMPAVYFPAGKSNKLAFAFELMESTQTDLDLRRNYQINPDVITEVAPAFTIARKFLKNDALSVGLTGHVNYRLNSKPNYTMMDLLQGVSLSPLQNGGDGVSFDADVGATYNYPKPIGQFNLSFGTAINNLMGGNYSKTISLIPSGPVAISQPTSFGLGAALSRASWGKWSNTVFALETSDIGPDGNGSFFRTLHLGAETHYGKAALRLGVNQGYWCAGVGFDLWILNIDVATYGEELSLNAGGLEDRRYAFRLALQI